MLDADGVKIKPPGSLCGVDRVLSRVQEVNKRCSRRFGWFQETEVILPEQIEQIEPRGPGAHTDAPDDAFHHEHKPLKAI